MKRRLVSVLALVSLLLLLFSACGSSSAAPAAAAKPTATPQPVIRVTPPPTQKPALVTSGQTSQGTPKVDRSASSFTLADADMYSTPDSSCFSAVGYNADYEILAVTFRESGESYLYLDFPRNEWEDFRSADSLGSYFNKYIKNNYACNKYS